MYIREFMYINEVGVLDFAGIRKVSIHHLCIARTPFAGPFVMNTREQIQEAMTDYRNGRNGFEKAHSWNSFVTRDEL